MGNSERRKIWLALFIGSFLLRFILIWHPPQHYFDEVYFAYSAQEMAKGNVEAWKVSTAAPKSFAFAWNHPFLGKEIMGLSVKLFGDHPVGWRMSSVLFGAASTVAAFELGFLLFGSLVAGYMASFLFTVDGLMFTMSRISTTDIILLFWHLIAFIGIVQFVKTREWKDAVLGSVGCALAFATKWSGALTLPMLFLFVGIPILWKGDDKFSNRLVKCFVLLAAIPFGIYAIVHVIQWIATNFSWKEVWEVQKQTWMYHKNLKATHPHQSAWWQWPLLMRSLWFYVDYSQFNAGKIGNIYALGNPLIWWGGAVAMIAALWQSIQRRDSTLIFIAGGFLVFWLPWAASPRISFLYHYMPALVFIHLGIVYWLWKGWNSQRMRRGVVGYLILVTVMFILFSPIYYGYLVPRWYFDALMWIPGWR